ncbi:unnamed protein product [Didymodactylos carnosus]|uniref:F-box domain-containing protein n=1 Tax=Didymodactylos carnosus TaxID=1234261 RepID=A0A814E0E2_9BILA|nr:unnamed protein product [Didymodactylos carnosus]CAF0962556.1 unnamed protein product [Didymodactylos carnosus]CAF3728332.1 unnamed protein product [Didymodactylos carnosus]CAF3736957.1 unnamed protein product [Didymodactylos carnosus]
MSLCCCINDIISTEILEKIFLSASSVTTTLSFTDLLNISLTCHLWYELTLKNQWFLTKYFNDIYKKTLIECETFDDKFNSPVVKIADEWSFLGKCAVIHPIPNADYEDYSCTYFESKIINEEKQGWSICFWVRPLGCSSDVYRYGSDDDIILTLDAVGGQDKSFFLRFHLNNQQCIYFTYCQGYSPDKQTVKFQLTHDEWNHLIIQQKNDGHLQLYANGQLVSLSLKEEENLNMLSLYTPSLLYEDDDELEQRQLFQLQPQLQLYFFTASSLSHSIADISVWSRALLSCEISAIYEQRTSINKVNIAKYLLQFSSSGEGEDKDASNVNNNTASSTRIPQH